MKIRRSSGRARASSPLLILFLVALVWPNGHGRSGAISSDPRATVPPEKPKETARADDRLSPSAFADPPVEARPGCFWDWLNGSITKEQITRDLEAMARGGLRGGEIWDVAAAADPDGRVPAGPAFLGPESARLIAHAIREADRLGLEIGLVASSGWNAGGSWIPPEHAGKGLYQSADHGHGTQASFTRNCPCPNCRSFVRATSRDGRSICVKWRCWPCPHDESKTHRRRGPGRRPDGQGRGRRPGALGRPGGRLDDPPLRLRESRAAVDRAQSEFRRPDDRFLRSPGHRIPSPPYRHHHPEGAGAELVRGDRASERWSSTAWSSTGSRPGTNPWPPSSSAGPGIR